MVEDVLGDNSSSANNSNNKVPMEKVVMLIWQFRDDPSVITFMARFMTKVPYRTVFCLFVIIRFCVNAVYYILSLPPPPLWVRFYLFLSSSSSIALSFFFVCCCILISTPESVMCWMVLNFIYHNWHI